MNATINLLGQSILMGAFMLWETLWPLVLGFVIAGLVQACTNRNGMERTMGNHRAAAVLKATGFGMLSSSCSYAATAMAKSLFAKGADFVTAMIFMVASTNLVVEMGLVLIVLMGWQFAAAEFVGGPIDREEQDVVECGTDAHRGELTAASMSSVTP